MTNIKRQLKICSWICLLRKPSIK